MLGISRHPYERENLKALPKYPSTEYGDLTMLHPPVDHVAGFKERIVMVLYLWYRL